MLRRSLIVIGIVFVLVGASWGLFRLWKYQSEAALRTGVFEFKAGSYDAALPKIRPFAERGSVLAQETLAIMYALGLGVPRDDIEAQSWIRRAECRCDSPGREEYGIALELMSGAASHRDPKASLAWLERAAAAGNENAQRMLAGPEQLSAKGIAVDQAVTDYWRVRLRARSAGT